MNFTHYTLGEALSSPNETIKRNAFSILHTLHKINKGVKFEDERPTNIHRETVWKPKGNRIYKDY